MSTTKGSYEMQVIREWKSNLALQKEFNGNLTAYMVWKENPDIVREFNGNRQAYAAFIRNSDSGRCKVIGNRIVK